MKNQNLLIEVADKKLKQLKPFEKVSPPRKGWVNTVRVALRMSLRQFAERLNISPSSAQEIELREASGSITLRSLRDAANALNMKLVYGLVPKNESIEKMIEKRANEIAREIVMRTSQSMKLEDQENSEKRIAKAIKTKTEELKNEMPKYLWDLR